MLKKFRSVFVTLMASTVIGVCSSRWLIIWVCLEINTLAICWIITKDSKQEKQKETATFIYFIIQVITSILVIITALQQERLVCYLTIIILLIIKIGVWPIHIWYIKLINSLEIKQPSMMVVITWQKILPIILIIRIREKINIKIILTLLVVSTLVTPITNLIKELSIKRIIALSSFNNNAWLLVSASTSLLAFSCFLTLYASTLIVTLKRMWILTKKTEKIILPFWSSILVVRNIGGLPPLTMFWSKILVVKSIIRATIPTEMSLILIITACYFLYHYLWITLNETSWTPNKIQHSTNKQTIQLTSIITATRVAGTILLVTLGLTQRDLSW